MKVKCKNCTPLTNDSIVNNVLEAFISRSNVGTQKYGVTLDREDLTPLEWLKHAQEEAMDFVLYLEKLKKILVDLK
jgi:hypothetical protein